MERVTFCCPWGIRSAWSPEIRNRPASDKSTVSSHIIVNKNWEIASGQLMFHGLALLAVSGHPRLSTKKFGAGALALGSALFSGSLYALVLLKRRGKQGAEIIGPITPMGG